MFGADPVITTDNGTKMRKFVSRGTGGINGIKGWRDASIFYFDSLKKCPPGGGDCRSAFLDQVMIKFLRT